MKNTIVVGMFVITSLAAPFAKATESAFCRPGLTLICLPGTPAKVCRSTIFACDPTPAQPPQCFCAEPAQLTPQLNDAITDQ